MKIGVPKEIHPDETRVALTPTSVEKLTKLGAQITIEKGAGESCEHKDEHYQKAGAQVTSSREELFKSSDMVVRLRKPDLNEIAWLKEGALHISYLDPFNEDELIKKLLERKVSAISMEMIPRTTKAQKMDALSSQASLAGYVAVVLAAERLTQIFPMMMTPAGTISPTRVFIIGAGVAGLQAIATAKRLGARVEAYDTRPVVEEQVQSLGAKFVKIDVGETGQTAGGYAKALTEEQIKKQQEAMTKYCAQADVVITTAQVFGKKAPRLLTASMISQMKPGSIVVDMAVESGGNVEGSELGKEVVKNGVRILGLANLPGKVCVHASQMYSSNITSLIEEFWDKEKKSFRFDLNDEILKGCLITHQGSIVSETYKNIKK